MRKNIIRAMIALVVFIACLSPGQAESKTAEYRWTYKIYDVPVEVSFTFEAYDTDTDEVYYTTTVTGTDGDLLEGSFEVSEDLVSKIAFRTISASDGKLSEYDCYWEREGKEILANIYAEWYPEKLTVDIPIEKKWVDMEEPYPDIEIQLLQDGEAYGDPVTLTNDTGWTYTFTGLDRFKEDGYTEYVYSIVELTESDQFKSSVDGYVITNTGIPEEPEEPEEPEKPKTYTITVNKQFIDDGKGRPEEIKVNVLDEDETVLKTVILSEDNDWSAVVKDLPTDKVHLQEVEVSRTDGVPYLSEVDGTTITNTPVFTLDIFKKVPVGITLDQDINLTLFKVVDNKNVMVQDLVLNKSNNYHIALDNLYACDTYVIYEKDCNGSLYSGTGDTISHMSDNGYSLPFRGESKTVSLTLFNVDDTELTVYKTWVDSDGKTTEAPVSDISFKLYNNGKDTGTVLSLSKNSAWKKTITLPSYSVNEIDTKEKSDYGWYITPIDNFGSKLVKNTYTVKEQTIDGWSSTVTQKDNTITVENKKAETKKPEVPEPKKAVPNTSVS